ncbi:SDR family oxidoreductase [Aureibacter tunicatorum]|uniref:dTDP-4-dehydrorhamnose reductase n=1 Tax=Aureibacter tunicatorum TaxID=866807 RepID=A0AAE4BRX5_9BACT|nr:SDR family oxidoreductase [Aureibacter tunicatorum]MDR6238318.1 dTDP-4-dehydrorhamnose reductase [Aureibacter tunicatorum]BDD03350.1 NAD(P)-dependent oxidoreductase [Aureibacter tunicatorum]
MKILITGSNGLLGQKLVEIFSNDSNVDLIATSRGGNRLNEGNYAYHDLDVTKEEDVHKIINQYSPHAVIHTAAMTNVDKCEDEKDNCYDLNVNATKYIVEACEKASCFLLHISTDFIFDGNNGPYDENAEPNPINYYGETKLEAEKLVTSSTLNWAIARTVLVYGQAQDMSRSNIILWVKDNLEKGKALKLVTDQLRSPTLAEDLAQGCKLIVEQKAEGIFNVSGDELLTPYEMAIITADFFKLDKNLISAVDGSTFQQRAARPLKTGLLVDKMKKLLGYQPRKLNEGISILTK